MSVVCAIELSAVFRRVQVGTDTEIASLFDTGLNGEALKISVPNAFVVSDKSFPAGVYTVERTPATNDSPTLLVIQDLRQRTTALIRNDAGSSHFVAKPWRRANAKRRSVISHTTAHTSAAGTRSAACGSAVGR